MDDRKFIFYLVVLLTTLTSECAGLAIAKLPSITSGSLQELRVNNTGHGDSAQFNTNSTVTYHHNHSHYDTKSMVKYNYGTVIVINTQNTSWVLPAFGIKIYKQEDQDEKELSAKHGSTIDIEGDNNSSERKVEHKDKDEKLPSDKRVSKKDEGEDTTSGMKDLLNKLSSTTTRKACSADDCAQPAPPPAFTLNDISENEPCNMCLSRSLCESNQDICEENECQACYIYKFEDLQRTESTPNEV